MPTGNNKKKSTKKRKLSQQLNKVDEKKIKNSINMDSNTKYNEINFVPTNQLEKSIKLFQFCVEKRIPILLTGPVGSGKSVLIDYMAKSMDKETCRVQISDESDSKTLLGGYCCTDIPGEFEWRSGPLISAMKHGQWLILEDILSGQSNLLGMLRPLLEAESLGLQPKISNITSLNEEIIAHKDFRIILTQSLLEFEDGYREMKFGGTFSPYNTNCLNKCQTILIDKLHNNSIESIVKLNYKSIVTFLPKLLGDQGIMQLVVKQFDVKYQCRVNTPRDLFKFCHRISNINKSDENEATCYFLDAIDCFVHHMPDAEYKKKLFVYLGSLFNLNQTNVENILVHRQCKIRGDAVRDNIINIGRVELKKKQWRAQDSVSVTRFAQTRQMMQLLETLSRCVDMEEPVLLVSETGCGKTSTVQYLSKLVNRKLIVINMNQQSDSSDLLGGYKPVNNVFTPEDKQSLEEEFNELVQLFYKTFELSFNKQKNDIFLGYVKQAHSIANYDLLLKLISSEMIKKAVYALDNISESLMGDWKTFYETCEILDQRIKKSKCSLMFAYIEGALVQAIRNGDWVLLDEINLAPPEMLQGLSGLLESSSGSVTLTEKGDDTPVPRHRDFRLFACMNPATDVGKQNLPQGLRNRFTEVYLHELTDIEELSVIVKYYLGSLSGRIIESIVNFYLTLRKGVKENSIIDGGGNKPQFSLRTLCRALEEIKNISENELYKTSTIRAIYEAFCFSFKSQLSDESRKIFDKKFQEFLKIDVKSLQTGTILSKNLTADQLALKHFKVIMGYPIKIGSEYRYNIEETDEFIKGYKITESVSKNLTDLARIVSAGKILPVLVQGETSVGKTSLITYLAKLTGHICHRVNNHETTDIQEYIGSYVQQNTSETTSSLVFKEGVLVQAMRHGHWIILDELNLAPTDILEALNRVLDDNREIFIVETQTTIKAHPMFRLFATQNPPGLYGGRKVLSRALRNRFIELHFAPIPNCELVEILDESCKIPKNKGRKMVETMRKLQIESQELDVVHCKRNYISLRDLFRWARRVYYEHNKCERFFDWDRTMIEEGYLLLTGKARSKDEVNLVSRVLTEVFRVSDVKLNDEWFFSPNGSNISKVILETCTQLSNIANIEWTFDFRRIAVLLIRAIQCEEPVLLVGNTGCGKTTICQLAAMLNQQEMLTINCHMHTEASDFLGGLKPAVNKTEDTTRLFQWVDGPLIVAMKQGKMFLIDEISLADDSVLERLNSVLEKDRKLTLVENGESNLLSSETEIQSVQICADKNFQIVATMNPGGDFGKKELSPALRNRFTEIWCPSDSWSTTDSGMKDWIQMATKNLTSITDNNHSRSVAEIIVRFLLIVQKMSHEINFSVITIRDLLSWVNFINISIANQISLYQSIFHGAYMVIIDSINDKLNKSFYEEILVKELDNLVQSTLPNIVECHNFKSEFSGFELKVKENQVGIEPFYVELGSHSDWDLLSNLENSSKNFQYSFSSQTTGSNIYRLLRALQVSKKPLLLEGSPGVGKTSLVTQLAKLVGFKVVRINLSEQTDANDLFGCFLPNENGKAGELSWRDGPLLQALKSGDWILLDEMNLASQSVLECLNACLDHRGEIFIPEINQTFRVKPGKTRLFACQNPLSEGSGRKGLPKSFINRFTQVYMSSLTASDYRNILSCLYPSVIGKTIHFIVEFVKNLRENVMVMKKFGCKGSPWEFNLRDLCRWCDLMVKHQQDNHEPSFFVNLLFVNRFRTKQDQEACVKLYNELAEKFGFARFISSGLDFFITDEVLKIGQTELNLNIVNKKTSETNSNNSQQFDKHLLLAGQLGILESIMLTVNMGWLTVLVGPTGTGKTTIIQLLSDVTGNTLKSMSMNSAMDTTDLLGSFEQQKEGGKFKWVDSTLVESLRHGYWLILDTVNFCSPSVLDRLNGLLEPNGSLLLTERGLVNNSDKLEEIKPHKNFRLFLILDPDCGGEISKAMRNRGLEICLIPENKELTFTDSDLLAILTTIYKLGVKDADNLLRFHKTMILAQSETPQIKIGNINSLIQAAKLINDGYSLDQSLGSVYGDIQMLFNIREDVNRFINSCNEEDIDYQEIDREEFSSSSLYNIITKPRKSLFLRHAKALKKTIKSQSITSHDDKLIVCKLFMQYSTIDDLPSRLVTVTEFDEDLPRVIIEISEAMRTVPELTNHCLPIDFRWLPNWREFLLVDSKEINRFLFSIYNIENLLKSSDSSEIQVNILPSQLNQTTINKLNVAQLAKLVNSGTLSQNHLSNLIGFDRSIGQFIDCFRSIDMSRFCGMDNFFELRNVCKLFKSFIETYPSESFHWCSTCVYHITSIFNCLTKNQFTGSDKLLKICEQILDKINKIDLSHCLELIENDEVRLAGIKRNDLRLNYPHSPLPVTEGQVESVLVTGPGKSISVWKPSGEEELKKALCRMFFSLSPIKEPETMDINELVNHFDIETVRIWPLTLNLLSHILNSSTKPNSIEPIHKFLTGNSEIKNFLPPLPGNLEEKLSEFTNLEKFSTLFTSLSDWSNYLIRQGHLIKTISSCNYYFDSDSEEYQLILDSSTSYLKTQINKIWRNPNCAIFLLVNGHRSHAETIVYFKSVCTTNSTKRCIRSIQTRKVQLEFSKQIYIECAALLTSEQLRITRELKLLKELSNIQRHCIEACWNGVGCLENWMETRFHWFLSLEKDIFNLNETDKMLVNIGKLWIRWGCVQMKLFALMESLDPQSQLFWESKYLNEEMDMISKEKQLGNVYREYLTGIQQNDITERCWSEHGLQHPLLHSMSLRIDQLKINLSKLTENVGLRPCGDEKYNDLRKKTLKYLSKYGWNAFCNDSMESVIEIDSTFTSECSLASSEILDFFFQQENSSMFPDLIEPLTLGISRVLIGIELVNSKTEKPNEKTESATKICELFCQFPNNDINEMVERILNEETTILKCCQILLGDCTPSMLAKIHIRLLHLCLRLLNFSKSNKTDTTSTIALLHRLLSVFSNLWAKQQQKQLEKEEAESSMFVEKNKLTENLTEEEIENLEIFLNVCPNDQQKFDDQHMQMSASMSSAATKLQELQHRLIAISSGLTLDEDTIHSVVNLTARILNSDTADDKLDSTVFRDCYRFAAALISVDNHSIPGDDCNLFAANLAALNWEHESLSPGSSQNMTGRPHDIYQDPIDVDNLLQAQKVLPNVNISVTKLLGIYPEHTTLVNIQKKINNILIMSGDYSLIVFINNVERLIHDIQQWEIVAARHVSLIQHVDELNGLLISWRHQELTMWENTISTANWQLQRAVSREFFNHYNSIVQESKKTQYDNDFESINLILEPILNSLLNSSVGNFECRLKNMKLSIDSLISNQEINQQFKDRLKYILLNHYDFYRLYLGNVQEHLAGEYKRIGKELKDFIKTKRWGKTPPKITDVLKCHKIVFKYKRQWNGIINQPCCTKFFVLTPINALKLVKLTGMENSVECAIDFSKSKISKWCESMLEYCREMWETMESFQRETKELEETSIAQSKSEEDKEVLEKKWRMSVKNLQQRKRNCITQFVKELREMGLMAYGGDLPRKTMLMTHLPLGDIENSQMPSSTIRCLSLRLEVDDADKSDEFAKFNDFKNRLISICDHLLSIACTNTTKIKHFESEFDNIRTSIEHLYNTCQSEIIAVQDPTDVEQNFNELNSNNSEKINQWDLFIEILKTVSYSKTFPSLLPDDLKPSLLSSFNDSDFVKTVRKQICENNVPKSYLINAKHVECLNHQKSIIKNIKEFIEIVKNRFSPEHRDINSSITDSLLKFNESNERTINKMETSIMVANDNFMDTNEDEDTFNSFVKELEAAIADKLSTFKNILLSETIDSSFIKVNNHINALEHSLDTEKILDLFIKIKSFFYNLNINQVNKFRILINKIVLPKLKCLETVEREFLTLLLNYHRVLISATDALLTVTTKLMKEGFCTPNDSAWNSEEENSNPNEKLNDFEMAGMDGGVGTNDVTDEIESESQIEGNSKDKEKEETENQQDIPDEDDGIEMTDDFNGKMHDPEVDESKENENNNEELNDLEDKMGEVGNAPETDVNKEAWDNEQEKEENDNEDKDKNKDERKGGVSEENTVEMVADNKDDNSKQEGNKKENSNELNDGDEIPETDAGTEEDINEFKDNENPKDNEDSKDNEAGPETMTEESEKVDYPEEESNPLDDFWNEESQLDADANEADTNQTEETDIPDVEGKEENIDELQPIERTEDEEVISNEVEQEVNMAGGNDVNENHEMTCDNELGEEDTEMGATGKGSGATNSMNTENTEGNIDNNEPKFDNKESSDRKQDILSKPCENRTLGDVDQSFKRKADILDEDRPDDSKRPKTTDAFSHIDSENPIESSEQILDDATAQQQQHIPEINQEENVAMEDNCAIENEKNPEIEPKNMLNEVDHNDIKKSENRDKVEIVIQPEEKQIERFTWAQYESKTEYLSRQLCEMLRIVLEPTKANKLGGAYRTGKRLNMKKVIPYIASGFRKDKIWLRRNKPSQREYQVIIGVDNSKSMAYNVNHQLFFESLSIVLNGLTFLEVGQVGLCKFGAKAEVVLPLYEKFSSEIGDKLIETFDFSDKCSKFIPILEQTIKLFEENQNFLSSSAVRDTSQLLLLLSDGGLSEDVSDPKFISLIREAHNKGIFVVVILLDHAESKDSILNLKMVIDDGCDFVRFLDVFPLQNYTVLQDVTKLPTLLTDVLRQWFDLSSSADKGPGR